MTDRLELCLPEDSVELRLCSTWRKTVWCSKAGGEGTIQYFVSSSKSTWSFRLCDDEEQEGEVALLLILDDLEL